MPNLYYETLEVLTANDKTPGDVLWVGSSDGEYAIGWGKFANIADVEYDNGFGAQEIVSDLVVVGEGWWLERHEYDGSEGWTFKCPPIKKPVGKDFDRVKVLPREIGWITIDDTVRPGGKYGYDYSQDDD